MDSKAAIRLGKGSLRERVKALGNKKCRASPANSEEQIRSVSWEKKELRVNPIFCCHGSSHFLQRFRKKLTKSMGYRRYFILSSRYCSATYLGSLGYCLELALRPGVQHSALETELNLERVLPMATQLTALPLLFRADSGLCSLKIMQEVCAQACALSLLAVA
jgi:hypothetical protein